MGRKMLNLGVLVLIVIFLFFSGCATIRPRSIMNNSVPEVREAIERGADVNAKRRRGRTALMQAVEYNSLDVAELLIEKGADVDAKDKDGNTALIWAVDYNQLAMAKYLIKKGADVKAKNRMGETPLMKAAGKNSLDFPKLLIKKGADVNAKAYGGNTALMWAASSNSLDVAKYLIKKGADVNAKNRGDWTALMHAEFMHHNEMITLLKEYEKIASQQLQDEEILVEREKVGPKNIAVCDLEARAPVSPSEAAFITDFFRDDLFKADVFNVVERNKMRMILEEQKFQQTGCTTSECAIELGHILNVEEVIIGSCGKLLDKFVIVIRMIDVETGKIIYSNKGECLPEAEKVAAAVSEMVDKLIKSLAR